ncbi:MAG: hypothetical protein JSS66_09445 [Armatimonadetes bacterium]|nr:hypothetical protein [Armatimonadota bacterium]
MSDKEREHPRTDPVEPVRPNPRTQRTPKEDYEIPIPSEEQFLRDLKRASRKSPKK